MEFLATFTWFIILYLWGGLTLFCFRALVLHEEFGNQMAELRRSLLWWPLHLVAISYGVVITLVWWFCKRKKEDN
jgi:hypothetical protein